MAEESDTKRAVLQGVYEDNLGLPRSFRGKRTGSSLPVAPGRSEVLRKSGPAALLGLLTLIVLVRLGMYGAATTESTADAAPIAAVSEPRDPPHAMPSQRLAVAGQAATARPPLPVPAGTVRYDEMLSHLQVPIADLFDLGVQTIVIDPGHGGYDPGAIGHEGLEEKDVVLDIARRLRDKLVASGGYRVLLTRDDDTAVRLKDRVEFASRKDADLFISLHINSVPERAGPVNYVETYYFGPHEDERTLDLARKENSDSDYVIGDFREIISRIGDTVKTEESARLAAAIHERLYSNLKRRHSSDILDAGYKSGPFVVLLGVDVPSVLVEISCISNEAEAIRLSSPEYRDSVAAYLESGIVDYLAHRNAGTHINGVNARHVGKQE